MLYGVSGFFLLVCLAFIASVVQASWPAWSKYGLSIVYGTTWNQGNSQFGALPLIAGTFETTAIALVLAVPIGIGTALAITHLLHRRLRTIATSVVSVLASVPSVVYGLWGLLVVGPYFADHIQPWLSNLFRNKFPFQVPAESLSLLLAGFILSIMVLPLVVALSRDAIASVPKEMEEGALSLGASRWQVFRKVILPSARTGITGAVTLATARALGETVAVAMTIGLNPAFAKSLNSTGATLASIIATEFQDSTPIQVASLAALAVILMAIIAVNVIGRLMITRQL